MSFDDIMDLIPESPEILHYGNICKLYERSLELLNEIKTNRYNAAYFGSLQIGPNFYNWKDDADFTNKYMSAGLYILRDLYNKEKNNNQVLCETSISILYSMLSMYLSNSDYSSGTLKELLEENDKFENKVDSEFLKGGSKNEKPNK
jgi:hypothetical protein